MTAAEVRRGIESLKGMCDPRGHELLDCLGEALIAQVGAVDMIDAAFQIQVGREWVEGVGAPPYVTTKVTPMEDIDVHSRRVPPLRSVS